MVAAPTPDPLGIFPILVGRVLGFRVVRHEDFVQVVVEVAGALEVKQIPLSFARDLGELLLEAGGGR